MTTKGEVVACRVTPEISRYLTKLQRDGGHRTRGTLLRSILEEMKRDDEAAEGRTLE